MSAEKYLDGIPRVSAPRSQSWRTLLLWLFLAVMFVMVWRIVHNAPAPRYDDEARDEAPSTDSPVDGRALILGIDLVLFGLVAGSLAWSNRRQRRALAPLREVDLALSEGATDRATIVLREALGRRPEVGVHAGLLMCLGRVASERGDHTEALGVFDEAQNTLGPPLAGSAAEGDLFHVQLRLERAESLLALGRLDEAEAAIAPSPPDWMPAERVHAITLSIRLASLRRDHATVLRLLDEHAPSIERMTRLRERWLLRAVEHLARRGHVPDDALPEDPELRRWIAARVPGLVFAVAAEGGAA